MSLSSKVRVYKGWSFKLGCLRWWAWCFQCPESLGVHDTWSHRHAMTWADNHVKRHRDGSIDKLVMELDENEVQQFRS